jgi:cytochrome c553
MLNIKRFRMILVLAAIAGIGCTWRWNSPERTHMFDHFVELGAIQTAVVEGELDRIDEPARSLAEHQRLDSLPAEADVYLSRMREAASELLQSATLQDAATGTARLATTCGSCHQAFGGPTFSRRSPPPPDRPADQPNRMVRHLWAADRMLEGLIDPSTDAWSAGAAILADDPMVPQDLAVSSSPRIRALVGEVNRLGARAANTVDANDRAELYGGLLGTCSSCHTLVREN